MAWRIHDSVLRGEIDNRQRGLVRGRIWLHGLAEPVVLELQGNAATDLAGCLLTFKNPGKTFPLRPDVTLHPVQRGTIGDLTASRKVRVWDMPVEEAYPRKKQGLPVPEHIANCLYLEWFSEANGRVVIESTEYQLTISPPAWQLTPEEEQQRQRDAAAGFTDFLGKVNQALAAAHHEPPPDKEWDEYDYERFLRESDARTDKYQELLDKYHDHPDRDRLVAREMGWAWLEEALDEQERRRQRGDAKSSDPAAPNTEQPEDAPAGDDEDDDWLDVDEMNRICAEAVDNPPEPDPATEGIDWVRDEESGDVSHPLSLRAFNSSLAFWRECKQLGLDKTEDPDLGALLGEYQITGAKLAGALDCLAYGREHRDGPFIVAYLKRALSHLHAAQAALEKVAPKKLLPEPILTATRAELFGIREEVLRLMREFRGHSR